MNPKIEAIIWDCDGVLIDSPTVACKAAAEYLTSRGFNITHAEYLATYIGKGFSTVLDDIRDRHGLDLSETCTYAELLGVQKQSFARDLVACPQVEALLQYLQHAKLPMAVASDSDRERLHFTLGITGLERYFNGHIYSADDVQNRKPAPDSFLHAATKLGIAPENCLVIEDSVGGIKAARAAGMQVYAYHGASHINTRLGAALADAAPDAHISTFSSPLLWGLARLQPPAAGHDKLRGLNNG